MSRMRPGIRWKLATDSMVLHLRELLGSILLFMFALLVVALMLLMNELNTNLRRNLEQTFQGGCSRVGYIILQNATFDSALPESVEEAIPKLLLSQDCVRAAGAWQSYVCTEDCLHFLKEVQQDHVVSKMAMVWDGVEVFHVMDSAWEMMNLELYEGNLPNQYNLEEYNPIYLGYEYRNLVSVGDILGTTVNGTYIVAGILQKGSLMPTNLEDLQEFTISSAYSLDYGVLQVEPTVVNAYYYFSLKDGYEFIDAQRMIQQAAEERGWIVSIGSLDARLSLIDEYLKPVNRYVWQMLLVVGLTACLVAACYQTMSIITRKSEYGILYANGASARDLIAMILIENLVKMLISLILLMPLFVLLAQKVFTLFYGDRYMIQWMIWSQVSWKVLLVGLGMMLLSSILPVYTLTRYSPVELIGGNIT
ncbi:MAG: ABC transporter permease [Lachnospiraceae bacterium]|nr:ABC transporter permease [Lachnospiraceae bacterium]